MRRWLAVLPLLAVALGLAALAHRCDDNAPTAPFADDLPADTVFYLGVPDVPDLAARLRALPLKDAESWSAFAQATGVSRLLETFSKHEARLHGPAALVARETPEGLDWVVLLRAPIGGSGSIDGWHYEVTGGRAVVAANPESLRRYREAPRAPLNFAVPGGVASVHVVPSAFPSPAWSLWCARWRDFEAIDARLDVDRDVRVAALARYGGGAYRYIVRHALQAPTRAVPPPDAAAWTAQIEDFTRLWDDVTRALPSDDRGLVDKEVVTLAGLFRHPVRELIPRLGPCWGAAVTRTGSIVAAVEMHGTPEMPAALRRAIGDYANAMRNRGRPVRVELDEGEPKMGPWRAPLRAGEGRLELGTAPPLWGDGEHHLGTVLDLAALRSVARSDAARPLAELAFGDVETLRTWMERLGWAQRAEAWTRYADAGARVQARLTLGGP